MSNTVAHVYSSRTVEVAVLLEEYDGIGPLLSLAYVFGEVDCQVNHRFVFIHVAMYIV